jgi:DNA modification methylase
LGYNPHYQGVPFTDFATISPETDLSALNLNWRERDLPERVRTKHVHRLHPYLGKFIPQTAEIFLRKFAPTRVCDPFVGSGTTLVEANALGVEAIGCDLSPFHCLLAKVKTDDYDLRVLAREVHDILLRTEVNVGGTVFAASGQHDISQCDGYLATWFAERALRQLLTYLRLIPDYICQDALKVILSRAARSARLTPHHQLDFPDKPQREPYYCHKHFRTCQPTDDAMKFLRRYSADTLARIGEFAQLRAASAVRIICGDARTVEFPQHDLILTSPPYVGLIDYHEQHRCAYELLALLPDAFASVGWTDADAKANEPLEIGAAAKGVSNGAKTAYVEGIVSVLRNVKRALVPHGTAVIIVADRHGLYGTIAEEAGFEPEALLERHVNRRTGRRSGDFFEQIMIWRPKR